MEAFILEHSTAVLVTGVLLSLAIVASMVG